MKRYWKDEYEYMRILEILDTYWLTEPDEACVIVSLDFLKEDGQKQGKDIIWINPKGTSASVKDFIKETLR